jgi:hypothetical protein
LRAAHLPVDDLQPGAGELLVRLVKRLGHATVRALPGCTSRNDVKRLR